MLYRSLYGVIIFVGLVCSLSEPWDGSVTLDDKITLLWDRHRRSISFRVESTANSWVGIGFNPGPGDGPMTNADMVILSKVGAELQLLDYWSSGFVTPDKDDTPNLENTTFGLTGDLLWFEFTRDWNTKDNMDNPIRNGENTILWAYGSSSEYGLSYHTARGHTEVDLSQDGVQEISKEEEGHHHHHNTNPEEFFTFKYLHQESAGEDHHHSHDEDDDNHSHHDDKIDNHHSHEDDDNHSHKDDSHFEPRSLKNDETRRGRTPPDLDDEEDNHTSRRNDEDNKRRRSSRSDEDDEYHTSRSSRSDEDDEHRTSRSSRNNEDDEHRTSRSSRSNDRDLEYRRSSRKYDREHRRYSRSEEYDDGHSSKSTRRYNQSRRSGHSRSIDYESENLHRSRDNKK